MLFMPFSATKAPIKITQGLGSAPSHSGRSYTGLDFGLTVGSKVLSMANGQVVAIHNLAKDFTGPTAFVDANEILKIFDGAQDSLGLSRYGNFVTIEHRVPLGGGDLAFYATYAHLGQDSMPGFAVGDRVARGDVLGLVGWTGLTTGAHLHIQVGATLAAPATDGSGTLGPVDLGVYAYADGTETDVNTTLISTLFFSDQFDNFIANEKTYLAYKDVAEDYFAKSANFEGVENTVSFATAVSQFGVSDGSDVAELYLKSVFGPAIRNVAFSGSAEAAFLVKDFKIFGSKVDLEGGLFLSSGGFPGPANSRDDFSTDNGAPGDADLDGVVRAAFPGAGATQDAAALEFDVFIDDKDVEGMRFDVVFGSDEYSEYSDSLYVDVAAIWVDEDRDGNFETGENKALFNGNPATPLSVIGKNLELNFIDNEGETYPIEWDGFGALSVRPKLQQGWNSIKIAIADTGDSAYDSGIYVTNFELLRSGGAGGNIFKFVKGLVGKNDLEATEAKEEFSLATGAGSVAGSLKALSGDVIIGFTEQIKLIIKKLQLLKEQIKIKFGSAILEIDEDKDGAADGTITLEGEFELATFNVAVVGEDTEITVQFQQPNQPPAADPITASFLEDDAERRIALLDPAFVSDPDGDPLAALEVVTTASDGRGVAAVLNPQTGVLSISGPQFEDLSAGEFLGISVSYRVSDGTASVVNAATAVVIGANDAPTPADDGGEAFATAAGVAFTTGNVLHNDGDPEDDALSVTGFDASGALGTVAYNGDGAFSYDPGAAFDHLAPGETAVDRFTYSVADDAGDTATASVAITVEGRARSQQIVVHAAGQSHRGDPEFDLLVNGARIAAGVAVASQAAPLTADERIAQARAFVFEIDAGIAVESVGVAFANDRWNGSPAEDRNLFVSKVEFGGETWTPAAHGAFTPADGPNAARSLAVEADGAMLWNGVLEFAERRILTVHASGENHLGNPRFDLAVNGRQVARGVEVASQAGELPFAEREAAADAFTFKLGANEAVGTVAITFRNDSYGGARDLDRNLFIPKIVLDGVELRPGDGADFEGLRPVKPALQSAADEFGHLFVNGTLTFDAGGLTG